MRLFPLAVFLLGSFGILASAAGQGETGAPENRELGEGNGAAGAEGGGAPSGERPAVRPPVEPVNPREVRLHLFDGSVITGELSVDHVKIATAFGELTVPIEQLRAFTPGLDSYPERSKRLALLIETLGGDDYNLREEAQQELARIGIAALHELRRFAQDGNAERRQRIAALLKELEAEELEAGELGAGESWREPGEQPWSRQDTVVTGAFTIVGKIEAESFEVNSKYGTLRVRLADIRRGERTAGGRGVIQKSLTIDQTSVAHSSFKSTGVRVEAGDRLLARADGRIAMTPWGSEYASTPDGAANFDWMVPNEIPYGALVGRIGTSGKVFKIGARYSGVAKQGGMLYLAVALDPDYTTEGYTFPGEYQVQLKIEPR